MLKTKRFNLVFAKTVHPNEHDYFETMLHQPSFAILIHALAYGMMPFVAANMFNGINTMIYFF